MTTKEILLKIIHGKEVGYNELSNGEDITKQINELENQGLIKKINEKYQLTTKGKSESTYIDGLTGKIKKQPMDAVVIIAKDGEKILMQQRQREPFHGYWGFPSGKHDYGMKMKEMAQKEFYDETGLTTEVEYKGLTTIRTYENGEIIFHHNLHIFQAKNWTGELIEKTREGINKWIPEQEINKIKIFPDILQILKIINENLNYIEMDRYQKNGEFI